MTYKKTKGYPVNEGSGPRGRGKPAIKEDPSMGKMPKSVSDALGMTKKSLKQAGKMAAITIPGPVGLAVRAASLRKKIPTSNPKPLVPKKSKGGAMMKKSKGGSLMKKSKGGAMMKKSKGGAMMRKSKGGAMMKKSKGGAMNKKSKR